MSLITPIQQGISRYSVLRVFNRIRVNTIIPYPSGTSVIIKGFMPTDINNQTFFPLSSLDLVNAVNELNTLGTGGIIVLSKGTYTLTNTLTLNGNIRITGGGTIEGNGISPLITLGGTGGNILENIKVNTLNSTSVHTLVSIVADNNLIQDCYLTFDNTNDLSTFLSIQGNDNVIRRCFLFSNDFDVGNTANTGINVEGERNKVWSCIISAFQFGIRSVAGSQIDNDYSNNLISTAGNHFQLTGSRFIINSNVLLYGTITLVNVSDSILTDNVLNCDTNGFILTDVSNSLIAGNGLIHNFGLAGTGIIINGIFSGVLMNDNSIRDFPTTLNSNTPTTTNPSFITGNTFTQEDPEVPPYSVVGALNDVRYEYNNGISEDIIRSGTGSFNVSVNGLADIYNIELTADGSDANLDINVPALEAGQAGKKVAFNITAQKSGVGIIIAEVQVIFTGGFGFSQLSATTGSSVNANAIVVWTGTNWTINDNYAN